MGTWENKAHIQWVLSGALSCFQLTDLTFAVPDEQFLLEGVHVTTFPLCQEAIYTPWNHHRVGLLCFMQRNLSSWLLVRISNCGIFFLLLLEDLVAQTFEVCSSDYFLVHHLKKKAKARREEVCGTCSLLFLSHSHRFHHSDRGLGHRGLTDKAAGLDWAPCPGLLSSAFQEQGLP